MNIAQALQILQAAFPNRTNAIIDTSSAYHWRTNSIECEFTVTVQPWQGEMFQVSGPDLEPLVNRALAHFAPERPGSLQTIGDAVGDGINGLQAAEG